MTKITQTDILFLDILTLRCYSEGAELDSRQAASGNLNAWHESETTEQKELTQAELRGGLVSIAFKEIKY